MIRPRSPATRAERTAGFTLLEMMGVMMIVALIAGLAVTMAPGTGRPRLEAVALQTAALFRRERLGAILTARDRVVLVDGESRAFVGDGGGRVAIPGDVLVDILGIDAQWSGRQVVVRFLPDGASSGTVVKFSRAGAAYEVWVNWYTGGVTLKAF
jgi:general secretion pathway protein H